MLSSTTNFKALSLNKFRDLFFFKLKSYLSLSVLLALFLSFSLTGCNWQGTANKGGNEPPTFSVSFYDADLNLLEKYDNLPNGHEVDLAGNKTAYSVTDWYFADNTTFVTFHALTSDVNFYAVPNVIEITNQTELDNIRTNLGGTYILLNDIDLNATQAGVDNVSGWNPIGGDYSNRFAGIFNGNGNRITGLWIDRTSADNVGLFGYIQNAQIKNLTVEAAEVKGNNYVGGIAGNVRYSTITNSHSTANVNGNNYVGGIAGYIRSSTIADSHSTANVNGNGVVGGIVGDVYYNSNVADSYSTGNVSGTNQVGGIVGTVDGSTITNSYAMGNVNGSSFVGGIAGSVEDTSVTNSYSAGNVHGNTHTVGGIAGYILSGDITNNAAINPSVTGANKVNRIAGDIYSGTVANNFALDSMGGIFTDKGNPANHGTDKTDEELKQEETYNGIIIGNGLGGLGWDFDNIWKIDEGNGYPYLYWQD